MEAEQRCELHMRVRENLINDVHSSVKQWQRDNYHKVGSGRTHRKWKSKQDHLPLDKEEIGHRPIFWKSNSSEWQKITVKNQNTFHRLILKSSDIKEFEGLV